MKFKHILLAFCVLFLSVESTAQMSGSYTIGGTSGPTNYATWTDFATDFNSKGVSGKVTVTVKSNTTISAAVSLKQHSTNPTNSTNTLTIDGGWYSVSGSEAYELLLMDGVDYVEIKNVKFINSSTSATLMGIRFANGANDNTINSCSIDFSGAISASSSGGAYIAFTSTNSSPLKTSSQHLGVRNTVKSCTLTTSASSSPGPTYAILTQGGTTNYSTSGTENVFSDNIIRNFYHSAFYSQYTNGDKILNNNISRSAASSSSPVDTLMECIEIENGRSGNQALTISGNSIQNLPFSGATSSATYPINTFYGIKLKNSDGSTSYPILVESNTVNRVICMNGFWGMNADVTNLLLYSKNRITNNTCVYGYECSDIRAINSTDISAIGNYIAHENMGTSKSGIYYSMYFQNVPTKNNAYNEVANNTIDSCLAGVEFYGITAAWAGSWNISRNRVTSSAISFGSGQFLAIFMIFQENLDMSSNLIANNSSPNSELYGIYVLNYNSGYKSNYCNNTVYIRSSNTAISCFGIYAEDESEISYTGNVLDMVTSATAYPVNLISSANLGKIDNNTFYLKNPSEYWAAGSNYVTSFKDWKTTGVVGSGDNFSNLNFVNVTKNDFTQQCFEAQNNVPYLPLNALDINKKVRNKSYHDRGAIESDMDIAAVKTSFTVPSSVCAAWESKAGITLKNNYVDTVYNFYVAFSVNGKVTREKVTKKILPGDTSTYWFKTPISLPIAGSTKIVIYADAVDDKLTNDSLYFSTTVKPAPGGSNFEPTTKVFTPNNPTYLRAKPYDVTLVDLPVIYDMKPPRAYTNSQYGTAWKVNAIAYSPAGRLVNGTSITFPTSSKNMELQFKTSDTMLEDSFVNLYVTFTDLNNGCDTVLKRQVFIAPRVVPNFTIPSKACAGDTIKFVNTSRIKSGYIVNSWYYGTGVSGDTSQDYDGYFIFTKSGKYPITLKAYSGLYGFVGVKTVDLVINEIPVAQFSRQNACTGADLVFVNSTTPKTATMYWDFGDGNGMNKNSKDTIRLRYSKWGTYNVTLKADIAGCIAVSQQKAFQFVTPKADFAQLSGRCSGQLFEFTNNSSIESGVIGNKWYFNSLDSNTNDRNGKWRFYKADAIWVKLVVKSEFGCKDSMQKNITVFGTPKAGYTWDRACKTVNSQFNNTTPDVVGTTMNYHWSFGDATTSNAKSPLKKWDALGKYNVKMVAESTNGCKDSISNSITVLESVFPDFSAVNACSGVEIEFLNQSKLESGVVTYKWDFGDNSVSTKISPMKTYHVGTSTSFNVTLKAYITGGCADSITKRIDIYEAPRTCEIVAAADYSVYHWGIKVTPKDSFGNAGGQDNVDYTFMIPGIDTIQASDASAFAMFDVKADGVYDVIMEAKMRNNGACLCVSDKQLVTVDRLAVKNGLNAPQWNVLAYPNPNYGNFTVVISGAKQMRDIKLFGVNGALIKEWKGTLGEGGHKVIGSSYGENGNTDGSTLLTIERGGKKEITISNLGLSAGVYNIEVNTELGSQVLRLMVE